MKEKQKEIERLKKLLSHKKEIFNLNSSEMIRLVSQHAECLSNEKICRLDIKSLQDKIEKLELEIKQSNCKLTRIYRIKPLTGARIYIEFSADAEGKRRGGVLDYQNIYHGFKSQVPEYRFGEAFINTNLDCLLWRSESAALGFVGISIEELNYLIS